MMKKSELFAQIVVVVSEATEITEQEILSRTIREEVVDARSLLVYFLVKNGFYPVQIAPRINRTPQQVRNLMNNYKARKCGENMLEAFEKIIGKRLESLAKAVD